MLQKIKSIIFWTAILFIAVTVFTITIGQSISYEFADDDISGIFYLILMWGFPFAIILTLFGTLKSRNTKTKNWIFVVATILASILSFCLMVSLMFTIGFGNWITYTTLYKHKTENKTIKDQVYDIGALGYGRHRIAEIKPVLKYWILPTEIDTTKIDKSQWKFVNEEGDIKFP